MPHRLVSVAILLGWAVAATALFLRDVLPDLLVGTPPDLRTIALADAAANQPTRWSIVALGDDPRQPPRSVGQVVTTTERLRDGDVVLTSKTWFDTGEVLRGGPLGAVQSERIGIDTKCTISPSGNLRGFHVGVRLAWSTGDLLSFDGRVERETLIVRTRAPYLPALNGARTFPYQPRSLVQSALGPLDRMPGLQVGQRWETRVVSPLLGQVEKCSVAVERPESIFWHDNLVRTHLVVTRMSGLSMKTWVRPDGLVLVQEVPLPVARLRLERLPEDATSVTPEGLRR